MEVPSKPRQRPYDLALPLLGQTLYDYTVEMMNRFKGLNLVDRMPEELWTEVQKVVRRQ